MVVALFCAQALQPASTLAAECDDGIDNDSDGRIDFPVDLGCLSASDDSEISDRDEDGVPDLADLCIDTADPLQLDSDGDGHGDACDADFNDDGLVDFLDLGSLKAAFFGTSPEHDLNSDGIVDFLDLGRLKSLFFQPPGASGPAQSAPIVSALEMDSALFPVPTAGQRIPLAFRFSFEDPDVDVVQLIVTLDGPPGRIFRLVDDFATQDATGTANRLFALEDGFVAGEYTLSVELVDAAENRSNIESLLFTLDAGMSLPIQITSISPTSAGPGEIVQITGTGFTNVAPEQLRVTFPGAERSADISSVVFDELNVIVPEGASSGPILLETPFGLIPSTTELTVPPTVTLSPATYALLPGESVALRCRFSGIGDSLVEWTASAGSVDNLGVYTAPADLPAINPVGVRCTWQGDPLLYAEALIEILPPTAMPGETYVLASEGGEAFTETREVALEIAPLSLPGDLNLGIQVPPRSVFPPDTLTKIIPASVDLSPAGVDFAQPATATFALRHWMAPGTPLQTYRAGVPVTVATVDSSGTRAVAALPSTGLYHLEADLAVSKDFAASVLQGVLGQPNDFEITRPRGTELLEGLRVPIVIRPTATPPPEIGPFFEGVEIEASIDGYGPINVGPRVQPNATAWEVGTILHMPVLTDCGVGGNRDGQVVVRYPAAAGSSAELTLDFSIGCLDELEFASGQPPIPMPSFSYWDQQDGRGRLRLIPVPGMPIHRFSRVVVGSGGELAPYQDGGSFSAPLILYVTGDIRVESGGEISTEPFDPPADPRLFQPIDGRRWSSTGTFGTGIAPGEGGDPSIWFGAMGGDGGGGTSDHGAAGDSSTNGGAGGDGGLYWEYADWLSIVAAGASTVISLAMEDWGGAAEGAIDVGTQVVRYSRVEASRMRGTGRGGRAAIRPQNSLNDSPHGGGGGGGSGKMLYECNFIFDFCPDEGGQGGGGGGGGAYPLEIRAAGSVFVEPGAAITGRGGPGGWGGIEIGGAPGGGGAGGNGAYIQVAADWVFNQGLLTTAGGQPGLSLGCVCPSGFACESYERVCTGDNFVIQVGNGERGRNGVFRIEAGLSGQAPQDSQFSSTGMTSDPWKQLYDFPFPGLADSDGDGLKDGLESWIGTRPDRADTDLDSLGDYDEVIEYGTDPTLRDTDGDGLSDGDELAANPYVTDPLLADTDDDGANDGFEIDKGSDPTNPFSTPEICDGNDNDLDALVDEDCEVRLDHKGREFFIPFLPNEGFATPSLRLFIASEGFANVTVEYPVGTVIDTVSVTPDQITEVMIPSTAATAWTPWNPNFAVPISSNAVRVTASFDVSIVTRNREPGTGDRALALPVELLGQQYYAMTWDANLGANQAEFVVVATADDTHVVADGFPFPGGPLDVMLDRGEGFLVSSGFDLAGIPIIADKKVVVASGNDCAQIGDKYCEHLYEIALPVERWEGDYLAKSNRLVDLQGGDGYERNYYRVAVAQDDTNLWINGNLAGSALNAGDVLEFSPESFPFGSSLIKHFAADKPIAVAQFMSSLCDEWPFDDGCNNIFDAFVPGDASMSQLVPTGRFPRLYRFEDTGNIRAVNVMAPTADAASGSVIVDGTPIPPADFTAFPTRPDWSVATVQLSFQSPHTSESPNGHALYWIVMNIGEAATTPLGVDYDLPHDSLVAAGSPPDAVPEAGFATGLLWGVGLLSAMISRRRVRPSRSTWLRVISARWAK